MSVDVTRNLPRSSGDGSAGLGGSIVLRRLGLINPDSLDDYVADGGYAALRKVVTELSPGAVRVLVAKAGLRGRGGAGFDAARKWRIAAETAATERYVVGNAFGADDLSYGDRTLLENDPHAVLEGMAIAAYAIGARQAYVYCCADHSSAFERIGRAVRQAEERGFLGSGVLGTGFDCHVTVVAAPAGFAAGEETAAIAVIGGQRPMPNERPPYPAQAGLRGKPTVVNNAETLANVPWIVANGAEAFATIGSAGNAGTKLVTVVGSINRPGVFEVPLGTTLSKVIAENAGGLRAGRGIKAVQLGGPSGGCLPANALDTKLEFEAIASAGGIVGSGTLLVLDDAACMVDFARARIDLLASECCGRCVPGRLGSQRLAFIMRQIASGAGRPGDLDLLVELGQTMADGAVCGYGVTAANPVLTTLQHFRDEYEAHVQEKRCPAGCCEMIAAKTLGRMEAKNPERREELWKRKWPIRR